MAGFDIFKRFFLAASLLLTLLQPARAEVPEVMYFMNQGVVRRACYYKPPGPGPFPVMIYNQATPKPSVENGDEAPFLTLAKFYLSNGFVLFLPGRPLLIVPDQERKSAGPTPLTDEYLLSSYGAHSSNIISALEWLKVQSFVDVNRIFMSGHSSGGIQAVLLAERDLGIKGFIAFSPGALLMEKHPGLQKAMVRAVQNQKSPIFLIQPQNDFGLHPSVVLGPEVVKQRKPNKAKIFPAFGRAHAEGNAFAFNAPHIWGNEVLEFIMLCSQQPN